MLGKLFSVLRLGVSLLPIVGTAAHAKIDPLQIPTAWEQATSVDTAEAYTQYILDNPDSEFVDEALARIEMLDEAVVKIASAVRHSDLPEIADDAILGATSAEHLMNI